eukprot:gene34081-41251_t
MTSGMLFMAITVVILAVILIIKEYLLSNAVENLGRCQWKDSDPEIFQLKTKTNVFYDAGQWYHMSENFLPEHSRLRKYNRLSSANNIFYHFDADKFASNLNGVTRLMVYLGSVSVRPNAQHITFLDNPALDLSLYDEDDGILMKTNLLEPSQTFDVSDISPNDQRYITRLPLQSVFGPQYSQKPREVCMRYRGSIGGDIPSKGSWFTEPGDVMSLRHKMTRVCPRDDGLYEKLKKKKKYKLVLYQRDKTRRLLNQEEALGMLRNHLPEDQWEFTVILHDNSLSPCSLMHVLHDADILLTPHGFQSVLLLFLPQPSTIIEIFPYKYHRHCYEHMSNEIGVKYGYVYSPPTTWHTSLFLSLISLHQCDHYYFCRAYSRQQDVMLTEESVKSAVEQIQQGVQQRDDMVQDMLY